MTTKKLFAIFFSLFGFVTIVFLIYISLLGENNKIDIEIEKYFQTLKNQDYIKAYKKLEEYSNDGEFFKKKFDYDFGFLNYLALRDKFNCLETEEYKIEYKRHSFWLPFKGNDVVKVGLRMIRINDFNTFSILLDKNKPPFIRNYITVKRISGIWRIIDINGYHPDLRKSFIKVENRIKKNSFIVDEKESVSFKDFRIDYTHLKKMDIKIYKFLLNKVENMIDKPKFFQKIENR